MAKVSFLYVIQFVRYEPANLKEFVSRKSDFRLLITGANINLGMKTHHQSQELPQINPQAFTAKFYNV